MNDHDEARLFSGDEDYKDLWRFGVDLAVEEARAGKRVNAFNPAEEAEGLNPEIRR